MLSDHSALLLLKYGIPCHKNSRKLHLLNNLGHKVVHGVGGGGGGGLRMLVLLKLLMLMFNFCCF